MHAGRFRALACALALVCALAGCDDETGETDESDESDETTEAAVPEHSLTGRADCDVLIANYAACLLARPGRMERNGALFQAEIATLSEQSKDPVLSEGVVARCKAIFRPRLNLDCD